MNKSLRERIIDCCVEIKELLLEKNTAYGNSAFEPVNIFCQLPSEEQLNVRIDDKLSRIRCGGTYKSEDTELDLIGYLILKRVWRQTNDENAEHISGDSRGLSSNTKLNGKSNIVLDKQCSCADCSQQRNRLSTTERIKEENVVS